MVLSGAAGCSAPTPPANGEAVAEFAFVRDEAGILPRGQRRQAERELSEIAVRSGVFGVLVTAGEDEAIDPPEIYRPILAEVRALGGQAVITICTPDACGPAAGSAHSDGLDDAVAVVGSAPDPPAQATRNMNGGVREWLAYVAAVAATDHRSDE